MINSWGPFKVGAGISIGVMLLIVAIATVVITLKGYALWNAAKRDEKWWFIVLLVLNTFGILELVYLYFIAGKWHGHATKPANGPTENKDTSTSNPSPSDSSTPSSDFQNFNPSQNSKS